MLIIDTKYKITSYLYIPSSFLDVNYTKFGKNRYIILDMINSCHINRIEYEGVSNKTVIPTMLDFGVMGCVQSKYYHSINDAKEHKYWLNIEGFRMFSSSGYLVTEVNKCSILVIDMTQKEKHSEYIKTVLSALNNYNFY